MKQKTIFSNEQKKAIEGSIDKWMDIVNGDAENLGTENCPLCLLYNDKICDGCPVAIKTKEINCKGTPFDKWAKHMGMHRVEHEFVQCEECIDIAIEEMEFLEGLLKEAK